MASIRINRYISESGFCSRREADGLIAEERVTINGVIAEFNSQVSSDDIVAVDDIEVTPITAIDFSPKPVEHRPKIQKFKEGKADRKEGFKFGKPSKFDDEDGRKKHYNKPQRNSGYSKSYKPKKSY